MPHRTIVVGAGIGGLAAAALLAREGEVIVLEATSSPGGKMRQLPAGNALIDAGPTVLTMKPVFEELFDKAGASLPDMLGLRQLDILARHAWPDGARFDLSADETEARAEVGRLFGEVEAEGFAAFQRDARRIHDLLLQPFMKAPRPDLVRLLLSSSPVQLLRIDPFSTLWDALGRYFSDYRLRQLFGRYATYCGSSPFKAPATLMLVAHVEQAGVWAVDGGMHALARAMEAIARRAGATFRYQTRVTKIVVEAGRAAGVEVESGERIEADAVICNGDAAAVAAGAYGPAARFAAAAFDRRHRSLSAMTWSMTAEARDFDLHRHNVFFSNDYRAEFDDIFTHGRTPRQPTVYICASDRGFAEPVAAGERVFVLVNAPADGDLRSYHPEEVEACRDAAMNQLQRCGLTLRPQAATSMTPADFAAAYPSTGGALYGRASHGWSASFRRPGVRSRIPGLYLAGGSVHPGPGVPMAALSGMAAAQAALSD